METIAHDGLFASTRWSMVLEAADSAAGSKQSLTALSELCKIYWRPLYLFLRREGYGSDDAQDLTQGFFADLIETRAYARADKARGRFRSFLLGALKHFAADARDRQFAQKRGGGIVLHELDEKTLAKAEAEMKSTAKYDPSEIFDREWAMSLLRQGLDRLAQECALAGKGELFDRLRPYLSAGANGRTPYESIAEQLRRPATTLRKDVERWRARYRAILREEVRGTVAEDSDVDEELRHLYRVLLDS